MKTERKLLAGSTATKKVPIEAWQELINSDASEFGIFTGLRDIYRIHDPNLAELILESFCPNQCVHCIYPPDYHRYNAMLETGEWKKILPQIYQAMGMRRFIFGGRSLHRRSLKIIETFKEEFPDVVIGLIADGSQIEPMLNDVIDLAPGWLDISLEGLEREHDLQRTSPGSFHRTLEVLEIIRDSGAIERINILTCLTAINVNSVLDMVNSLNSRGFLNFFITPVTIFGGYRPDIALMPSGEMFVDFVSKVISRARNLTDTWLEVDIYETIYAQAIKRVRPEWFDQFVMQDEHLEMKIEEGDNQIHIVYYPSSLTGLREFIINSDGSVIPPKVMAMGKIPDELKFGNVARDEIDENTFQNMMDQKAFSFYYSEFMEERNLLR